MKIIFISETSNMSNKSKPNKNLSSLQAIDCISSQAKAIKLPYKGQTSAAFKPSDYY